MDCQEGRDRWDRRNRARFPFGGPGSSALPRCALMLLIVALWATPLRAHDNYTSFAEARVTTERIELTLTLARNSAQAFLPDAQTLPPITPANFEKFAAPLRAVAAELFQISVGGKPLVLASAEVVISGDSDITYKLNYPRPATGSVRFFAYYLGFLIDGHMATLVITNLQGDDLGWSPLSIDQPFFQVVLPAANAPQNTPKQKK